MVFHLLYLTTQETCIMKNNSKNTVWTLLCYLWKKLKTTNDQTKNVVKCFSRILGLKDNKLINKMLGLWEQKKISCISSLLNWVSIKTAKIVWWRPEFIKNIPRALSYWGLNYYHYYYEDITIIISIIMVITIIMNIYIL